MKGSISMDKRFSEIMQLYNRYSSAAILHRNDNLRDILELWEKETDKLLFCVKHTGKTIRLSDGEVINADALYNRIYSRADTYLKSLGV